MGLGVRDLRLTNLAHLSKWRWCLHLGAYGLWHDILTARYGVTPTTYILGWRVGCLSSSSPWWKGVSLLGAKSDDSFEWFMEGMSLRVGYGPLTSFWNDIWVGDTLLHLRFLKLVYISDHSTMSVEGRWVGGRVRFGLKTLGCRGILSLTMSWP